MMSVRKTLATIITALIVIAGSSQAAQAEPLRIGIPTWVGFGPMYVAEEKGFFMDEGVDAHTIKIEQGNFEMLIDGQIDAWATDFLTVIAQQPADERTMLCVFALDGSAGGDGVVATQDIQSIADLTQQSVI